MQVDTIIELPFTETVRLDGDRLGVMICNLDPRDAEDMVSRAVEELATRISRCETAWRNGDHASLQRIVMSLTGLSEQLGMNALARSASHVSGCIDTGDVTGTAATLARLIRVGDISLNTVWDIKGLSV